MAPLLKEVLFIAAGTGTGILATVAVCHLLAPPPLESYSKTLPPLGTSYLRAVGL